MPVILIVLFILITLYSIIYILRVKFDEVDFEILPEEEEPEEDLMSDFVVTVGVEKTLTPHALLAGQSVSFPADCQFDWQASDPSLLIDDPKAQNPKLMAFAATTGVIIQLAVVKPDGSTVLTVTHTVDAIIPEQDFDAVDFSID